MGQGHRRVYLRWVLDRLTAEYQSDFCMAACMDGFDTEKYAKDKILYGWHIADLKIYDTPRELGELRRACTNSWYCESCAMRRENDGACGNESLQIDRAPQSWCYVEAMEDV